jgi:membrane protein DedA with SNARE-associated domain/rhodanese-related sulfurtransferase
MESWIAGVTQHGYAILFPVVFLEAVGFPVPAALALLVAGAASAHGPLNPGWALGGSIATILLADILMFLMGRYTGWWLLSLLCRLSFNPESCILRAADSFRRRGRTLLVIAKFIPGINTMSPPLAGSMNMRFGQFLRLDLAGATLYGGGYFGVGFLSSDALGSVTRGYQAFGRVLGWVLAAAVVAYVAVQVRMWQKARAWRQAPSVGPAEAADELAAGSAVIYDVRSHGYYDPRATRIQGSHRLDPNALPKLPGELPLDKQVYVYCTCVREATSARVAQLLREQGVRATVIQGGLRAWKKAGLPVESVPAEEIAALPVFDTRR